MVTKLSSKWTVVCAAVLVSVIYCWHLDGLVLWGDEAGTAAFGRNILKHGVPYGFDGRNLLVYDNCASISPGLLSSKIPWLQYYIGAASLKLFGDSTFGSRLLFALIGAAAVFPLAAVIRRRSRWAPAYSLLLLLVPQVVLFQRNARYFSVAIFLYCLLLWLLDRSFRSPERRFAAFGLFFIVFFHLHHLAAACAATCLVMIDGWRLRKIPWDSLAAAAIGFGSWAVFFLTLGTVGSQHYTILHLLTTAPGEWGRLFVDGLKAGLFDLDFVNALPLAAWAAALACVCFMRPIRERASVVWKDPVCRMIALNLAFQVIATAALMGYETTHRFSLLRYMPHLICLAPLPLLLMIEKTAAGSRVLQVRLPLTWLVIGLVLGTNLFTWSYWHPGNRRKPPLSWWHPVYAEILHPGPDAVLDCLTLLKDNAGPHKNKVLLAAPAYMNEVFIFYAGDDYLVIPKVTRASACEARIVETVGLQNYARFDRQPDWIFLFYKEFKQTPPGYRKKRIPIFRASADAYRPELTRHGFPSPDDKPKGYVSVYRRMY